MPTVYDQLHAIAYPFLEDYHADLDYHDKNAIESRPGVPFLHWTRRLGTTIVFLDPPNEFPAPGVCVPYLFATADREHLLREVVNMASYYTQHANPQAQSVVHFDGNTLRIIDAAQALEIAREYTREIRTLWDASRQYVA